MIDWTNFLLQTAISASFATGFSIVGYTLFQRQNEKFDHLNGRVRQLEDEKIKGIQDRLDSGSEEFDGLHKDLCGLTPHTDFREHRLQCERRFDAIVETQREQEAKLSKLAADVASVKAIVSLIADHMHISIN